MSNAKHYIDVQEALDQQADKMLSEQGYSAGLFLKPAAKTPE